MTVHNRYETRGPGPWESDHDQSREKGDTKRGRTSSIKLTENN